MRHWPGETRTFHVNKITNKKLCNEPNIWSIHMECMDIEIEEETN